jgi:dethiobiotin synthetase
MRGLIVVGTDTGVGKTEVSCALLSLWAEAGLRPAPLKPCETGVGAAGPLDALALQAAAGAQGPLDRVCPYRFALPAAPAVAARREGRTVSLEAILALAAELGAGGRPVLVEGAGGLLVPFTERETFADLCEQLDLPVVVVARAGLGTVNHTALTCEALAQRNLRVKAVILNAAKPPLEPDPSVEDNAAEVARLTGCKVIGPMLHTPDPRQRRAQLSRLLAQKIDRLGWLA